jgi:hypothetical protein
MMLDQEAPLDKGAFELGKIILPMSLDRFFEVYLKKEGEMSFPNYYTRRGNKDVKVLEDLT